jgi:hypothetical protein
MNNFSTIHHIQMNFDNFILSHPDNIVSIHPVYIFLASFSKAHDLLSRNILKNPISDNTVYPLFIV